MLKFQVQLLMEEVGRARAEWRKANTAFSTDVDKAMSRLIPEGLNNFMSVDEIAKYSGFTTKMIRAKMRAQGLDPKAGKRALSKKASEALVGNAALLGIKPEQMDLTSPLAYLPAGSLLRQRLTDVSTPSVTELPEDEEDAETLRTLGLILLRFVRDENQYVNTDGRIVLDGSLWDATDEERELVRRVSGNAGDDL